MTYYYKLSMSFLSSLASVVEFLNQMKRNRCVVTKTCRIINTNGTVEHTISSFSSKLACSRLSVVGDARKRARKKRGRALSPPSFFSLALPLSPSPATERLGQATSKHEFKLKDVRTHCYCASLVRTLFIGHARATSFSSARTESKNPQNIELMTFALT